MMTKKFYLFIPILFYVFVNLVLPKTIHAATAISIQTIPAQPVYNQIFDCIITLDSNSDEVACAATTLSSIPTQPVELKDLCVKKSELGLGHYKTEGSTRYYHCLASYQGFLPGPGNYTLVAWEFWADGSQGRTLLTSPLTIVNAPPPTATPTVTPTRTPTPVRTQITATRTPTPTRRPTSLPTEIPISTVQKSPTPSVKWQIIPTISSKTPVPSKTEPTNNHDPLSLLPPIDLNPIIVGTKNFFVQIIENFFRETNF